jgi:tetratricopeptide (TPR) repeat protein
MRWLQTEYLLKGLYLGLLAFLAVQEATATVPDWRTPLFVTLFTFGGLALALGVAAYGKRRQGYQVKGRLLAFVLFLLLESPTLVYAGILLGTAAGAAVLRLFGESADLLVATVGGGVALGVLFGALRQLTNHWARLGLSLAMGVALVAAVLFWFGEFGEHARQLRISEEGLTVLGLQVLLGVPVFYLLTFSGREEESEVEIAAACAALGLGACVLLRNTQFRSLFFVLSVMFYVAYIMRVMPSLRVFKHALRGLSHLRVGRYAPALRAYRRALQLDPNSQLAREGFWRVHRTLNLDHLADDPQTLSLVDFDLCLDRAGSLLLEPPAPDKLDEANRLLDLVASQRPDLEPIVDYWRAVAQMHARRPEEAAGRLERVLDPDIYGKDQSPRRSILLRAWQLALTGPEELRRRVGLPQLALAGRRMEAIAAVERHLAEAADDQPVWGLKRVLYQDLSPAEHQEAANAGIAQGAFDGAYARQLGLALLSDPARWQRGCEYLRMAAHALPTQAPSIFVQIAQAHDRAGDADGAWRNYELVKQAGRAVGPKHLPEAERQTYFATVKMLADGAQARCDLDAAIENFHLYSDFERSGLETLRSLAALYEAKHDPMAALRITEQALLYDSKDKDFLARKDKYYYSVLPEELRAKLESVRSWFDVNYCVKKARELLNPKFTDLEYLEWASHLIELARIMKPDDMTIKVLYARTLLRRGEKSEAVTLLESVRTPKPEQFASGDDEEAWFLASRLLGELYLFDLGRPDLAVPCFTDFRRSARSGADTLFKLGQAYEQLGDRVRAVKCYKQVTGYDNHPLLHDAQDALYRLEAR